MKMLRQWNGDSLKPILEMLAQFGFIEKEVKILKYECLTPDSFLWVVDSSEERLCLYAEDFVPSLKHVKKAMEKHGNLNEENDEYELVKAKSSVSWGESSPVTVTDVYAPPKNKTDFMQYALPSGRDFVFLGKSLK